MKLWSLPTCLSGLWADTIALVHEFSRLSHRLQPPWQREAWMWNSWSWLWIMTVRITMKIMYIDVGELGLTLSKVNFYLYLFFWCNKPQKAGIGYMGFFSSLFLFCFLIDCVAWQSSEKRRENSHVRQFFPACFICLFGQRWMREMFHFH